MAYPIFILLAAVVLVANPSAAQTQQPVPAYLAPSDAFNKHMPKWLRFSGEYRARAEGFTGGLFTPDNDDAYLLNRIRLNMRIAPTDWLSFSFQAQDARAFWRDQGQLPPLAEDTMDLRAGYIEFGSTEAKSFGLRGGRQELAFGDQRLVGHVSWLNAARSFDAVRLTYRRSGLRADVFASSVVVHRNNEFDKSVTGDNFHGLYFVLDKLVPQASIEPFAYWRVAPNRASEFGVRGKMDFKTFGLRWTGKVGKGFDYSSYLVGQAGNISVDDFNAWAAHLMVGRTFAGKWTPRASLEYNFASGDEDPRDGRRGTFDILYPTPHDLYGLSDQVGWRNLHHFRAGVELKPHRKVRLVPNYHSWWRASTGDGLYNAGGALIVRPIGFAGGRHIGQEADFQAFFTINPRLTLGSGIAHIFPGTFLKEASRGASYTSPYLMLVWAF